MISLKINNYKRDEMYALYETLEEAKIALCDCYGDSQDCTNCPQRIVCNDLQNAIQYIADKMTKTKK